MAGKVRVATLQRKKDRGERIVMVTAYDYPTGRLAEEAGVDVVLVGDSLGNTTLGFADTIPVTLDHMVHHTAAVRRGVERTLLVADMPFMTYKISSEEGLRNAARLVQEGGAEAVKLEGGREVCDTVRRIVEAGIPVMGHVGLTPQSIHALSGYRVQGREPEAAARLLEDAQRLEDAGCFSIVLECLPWALGEQVTRSLRLATIGIGAGSGCNGQVLVLADLIGLSFKEPPAFVKPYARAADVIRDALRAYCHEVREGAYPDRKHGYDSPGDDAEQPTG